MCGIAGVMSKRGENVAPLVGRMLVRMASRGPDGAGVSCDGTILRSQTVKDLPLGGVQAQSMMGHARLAIVGGTCGTQPFTSCNGRFTLEHNGEIYNYKKIRARLEGRHHFTTHTDSEVIVHLLEDHHLICGDLLESIARTVAELDGIYALAIRDEETGTVVLARDRLGVRPMYYSENSDLVAFASERKALWAIGLREPTLRVLPGHALVIEEPGRVEQVKITDLPKPKVTVRSIDAAVSAYEKAFLASMEKRTEDVQRMGIIFSGGIDSVLVAYLASRMVPEVECYTCGVEGSSDLEFAKQIARRLGLSLKANELSEKRVEQLVPEIIRVIEDSNAGQVEVALPVYGAVELAKKDGIRIMLTGQGADELFGGYGWYANVAKREGYKKLRRRMMEDLSLLYKETLEREDKITMAHSVELREPFLDMGVVAASMAMDLRLNVKPDDLFGKRVHRRLAERLGIPRDIAFRVKEAAQHGSGVHDMLESIARKNGFDETAITSGYLRELQTKEKMGSSQRYGYLFEKERKLWVAEPHVQMYLDSIAIKTG
ncbi:MAG TPA: asparagine synthase (glutamine-hydrolyzing) [Nitrososphaera sp.]|jgi:asparagine synthase (glutamine-hydrolysing)